MDKYSAIQFKTPAEIKVYQEFRLAGELEYLNNHSIPLSPKRSLTERQ